MKLEGRYRAFAAAFGAIAFLGLTGAEASAQTDDVPALLVQTASLGQHSLAGVSVDFDEAVAARVDVEVPRDYGLKLGQPAGTEVGYVTVFLSDAQNSSGQLASGELVVDDPASVSAGSVTCAPGLSCRGLARGAQAPRPFPSAPRRLRRCACTAG